MKKIGDLIKPFAAVIFGALLLFYYLNYLQAQGTTLVLGIFALIFAIYFIGIGIVGVVLGDKLPNNVRKIFDVISIALFPFFIFFGFVFACTTGIDFGVTGWIIVVLSMNASIIFSGLFVVASFVKVPVLKRLAQLFGAIFVLALLVNILYPIFPISVNMAGRFVLLGEIDIVLAIIFGLFAFMLFNSFKEE